MLLLFYGRTNVHFAGCSTGDRRTASEAESPLGGILLLRRAFEWIAVEDERRVLRGW